MSHVDNPIHITHYIHPHCFYYKPETAYMQEHEQAKFANAFNEYCEAEYGIIYDTVQYSQLWKRPQRGDLVALRSNQLQRWIRCKVEELTVDMDQTTWYYFWAIDEGLPIKSHPKYVRPLPQAFQQEPAHAKRGAIINILPGETRYDYARDEQILVPSSKWSLGVVSTLELMLENAENISFLPTIKCVVHHETIFIGELFITTHTNVSHNVAKMLRETCSDQLIVTQNAKFLKGMEYLRALEMKRYLNNEGFDNHLVNKFVSHYLQKTYDSASRTGTQTDENADMKVYEWLKQNKEARIALLKQRQVDKDRVKESAITDIASNANEYPECAKHVTDENDETTDLAERISIQKHDESKNVATMHGRPSKLIKNIKRHQARLEAAARESQSVASE